MQALERARIALEGLSVGDALGGFFEFNTRFTKTHYENRTTPNPPWYFTDDTNMALSIYSVLRQYEKIDQDKLALNFATHYERTRGYGLGARTLLSRVKKGEYWREVTNDMFGGEGSFGNGGAMRVAPIGAYFADDLDRAAEQAWLSAEITHAHPEGIAGAIAVAVATAIAWNTQGQNPSRQDFIQQVLDRIPSGAVHAGVKRALSLPDGTSTEDAVAVLGNGSRVSAQDSVPFVIWNAARNIGNYQEAIWQSIKAGGDVDTLAAMTGGIIACHVGKENIPDPWIKNREELPTWAFEEEL